MTPIDSTNDQNICVELSKATLHINYQSTHQRRKLETALYSLLY